ncbi:hypothetical protein [Pseudomonas sp. H3(2019)]|uniref:hypothetical protein n=1 Tax=Pseudomonas sp. H3(2019) TaxID=2598724 RepID=UPI0015B47E14|nr:hypothetical protein [Pseudomonas sp. H3(2019)]
MTDNLEIHDLCSALGVLECHGQTLEYVDTPIDPNLDLLRDYLAPTERRPLSTHWSSASIDSLTRSVYGKMPR